MKLVVFPQEHTKETTPVTLTESDLSALLAAVKAGEMTDVVRESLAWVLQELIEVELTAMIGAAPGQHTEARTALRNGHRPKLISTAAGDVEIGIPSYSAPCCAPGSAQLRTAKSPGLTALPD